MTPEPIRRASRAAPDIRPYLPGIAGVHCAYPAGPNPLRRGDLVAREDALWRVLSVTESTRDNKDQYPWIVALRPASESLEWEARTGDVQLGCTGYARFDRYIDAEHMPVCSACGGIWPCHHLRVEHELAKDLRRSARYEIADVCPACQEPVTTRQTRQTWTVNLYAFNQSQPVTFHLRKRCIADAIEYDAAVRKAGHPGQLGYPQETK